MFEFNLQIHAKSLLTDENGAGKKGRYALLVLTILVLTIYWLLSFFDKSILPGLPYAGYFTDMLSIVIVVLCMISFLS
jgi:hypothetical protein